MLSAERNSSDTTQTRKLSLSDIERNTPLEELIATGEAAFGFIRHSEMELEVKNAFYQLEKQFDFYKSLLLG